MSRIKKEFRSRSRHAVKGPSLAETLRLKTHTPTLLECYPVLVEKYFSELNNYGPEEVTPGSGIRMRWICPNVPSHPTYEVPVNIRVTSWLDKTEAQCCPACSRSVFRQQPEKLSTRFKSRIIPSRTCPRSEFPYLNTKSRKTCHFTCPKCSCKYSAVLAVEWKNEAGCPKCHPGPKIDLNEYKETLVFFDLRKNVGFDLKQFPVSLKVWWRCPANQQHQLYEAFEDIANDAGLISCKSCNPQDRVELRREFPELFAQFDVGRNEGHDQDDLKRSARYHWLCSEGHSFVSRLTDRIEADKGCPYCALGAKPPKPVLSLYTVHASCFDEQRNATKAALVKSCGRAARTTRYWWTCADCAASWQETVYSFLRQSIAKCPASREYRNGKTLQGTAPQPSNW